MRPWTVTALVVVMAALAAPAVAQQRIYPSSRSELPVAPASPAGSRGEQGERGVPSAEPQRRVPDRARLRAPDGAADGFNDQPRLGRRGVARGRDGTATGSVDPNRLGGGVVRGSDGSARGLVPSPARRQEFDPPSRQ